MNAAEINALSEELLTAATRCMQIDPLTDRYTELTTDDAYAIQFATVTRRLEAGEVHIGKKIGLTSLPIQKALGVSEPDYGHLLSGMHVYERDTVRLSRLIQPRAEGEIAFVLDRDLDMAYVTEADVLRSTAFVCPAIEIIDSRIRNWNIRIQDTVADNASSALFVIGGKKTPVDNVDTRLLGMTLHHNDEIAETGAGAAALGSPVKSVAWLANTLRSRGVILHAGEIILSGGLAATITPTVGDSVRVAIEKLGEVTVFFE